MNNLFKIVFFTVIFFLSGNNISASYRNDLDSAHVLMEQGRTEEAAFLYEKALGDYKDHYKLQMDTMNEEFARAYEIEKKEQEIERLNQTLSLKKKQYLLFTLFIAILFTTLILFYILQKYRLKILLQQEKQNQNETELLKLEKEKKELEAQLHTYETEKYRKELLAGSLLVEHKDKIMNELRLFFASHPQLNPYKTQLEKMMTDDLVSGSTKDETELNSHLFSRLQKYADGKLTPLDLKYCRMIYLKMSSKEMADFLEVDPKTIRVTKYRLKQKLNLSKTDDLSEFIEKTLREDAH